MSGVQFATETYRTGFQKKDHGAECESRRKFAFRTSARALAAGLPRQDHVYKTTNESFHFHNKNTDEMRCKLESTENPRSFEKYPTLP